MTHTKTSTFRENLQRAILRACDLLVETFDQSGQRRHIKCLTLENNNLNMILQLRMKRDSFRNSCDFYEDMSPPPLSLALHVLLMLERSQLIIYS